MVDIEMVVSVESEMVFFDIILHLPSLPESLAVPGAAQPVEGCSEPIFP